jgi:hypothetical protein
MSIYVLGPSIENVVEPAIAPVVKGRQGIGLNLSKPTEPGGIVNFYLLNPEHPDDLRPVAVYAIYCSPPETVPAAADRTAEWFMNCGQPRGTHSIPPPPVDPGPMSLTVPGVKPGIHFVQTVLEYSA